MVIDGMYLNSLSAASSAVVAWGRGGVSPSPAPATPLSAGLAPERTSFRVITLYSTAIDTPLFDEGQLFSHRIHSEQGKSNVSTPESRLAETFRRLRTLEVWPL